MTKNNLIYGVAINDADYFTQIRKKVQNNATGHIETIKWMCPYYSTWKNMLRRCYSSNKVDNPTYADKYVCQEWLTFSNFKRWMEQQDWEGKQLDKDILVKGNKVYSPDACYFVPAFINNILLIKRHKTSQLPLGVSRDRKKFGAYSKEHGKTILLGLFDDPQAAHHAWQLDRANRIESALVHYSKMDCFNSKIAESLSCRIWNLRLCATKGENTYDL